VDTDSLGRELAVLFDDGAPEVTLEELHRRSEATLRTPAQRRPALIAVVAFLTVLAVGLGTWWMSSDRDPTADTSPPTTVGEVTPTTVTPTTASDQSTPTSEPTNTTLAEAEGIVGRWHYASGAIGQEIGRGDDFAFAGDLVAALRSDSRGVAVLDLDSGEEVWQADLSDQSGTILEFAAGSLTWATYDQVGAYSVDGEPMWEHAFDDDRWPSQAVVRDDLTAVALNPTMEGDFAPPLIVQFDQSGNVVWSVELADSRIDEDLQWGDLLVADDGVVVQTTDALYRLDWTTGTQTWRVPFAEADIETFAEIPPVYDDGVVYGADPGDDGEILGVDAATGETRMALQVGSDPRLIGVVDGWLIYTDETGVHGINTDTENTWAIEMPEATAVIADGQVIAVSTNTLAVLNPDGEQQSQLPTQIQQPQPQPVIVGEILLVPGWESTEAIDTTTGQTVTTWQGESTSNVLPVDERRALLGVAGDGIHLLEAP